MEYIYTALMLHKAGKEVSEANVKKVLEAGGIQPDDGRVKALIAALDGVNIEEAVKSAAPVAVAAPAAAAAPAEEKKEAKSAEDSKKEEAAAAAGLGSLFG